MKNFLNNKFNLIIILLIAIVLGFGNSVFANFDFTYNDTEYSLPDLPRDDFNDFFICQGSSSIVLYYVQPGNSLYYGNLHYVDGLYYIENSSFSFCRCELKNNSWSCDRVSSINAERDQSFTSVDLPSIIYSSFDIKDKNGNVVFQGAPQEQVVEIPEITQTLVEQGTQAQMGETLLATIKTYLIYLVIFVVSMLAIWKAVRFLRSVLKTS